MSHDFGIALRSRSLAALAVAAVLAGTPVLQAAAQPVVTQTAAAQAPLTAAALQDLVGPIALYPDDLVGIVLPASTYPLQIVQAKRFLDDRAKKSDLKPNTNWDDSVVALLNYPDVVKLMNDDLDWTAELGDAVVDQRADVLDAIQSFRDRAYAAGNLKTDNRQVIKHEDDGAIAIAPANPEVIYVPYYEPQRVVVYQPAPVYHYYPVAYPVYYYPYPVGYAFDSGFFWGVTTAFVVGWHSHLLHVERYGYAGHPYFGRSYYDPFYVRNTIHVNVNVNHHNDVWEPRHRVPGRPYAISNGHRVGGGDYRNDRNGNGGGDYRPRHRDDSNASPRQESRSGDRTVEQDRQNEVARPSGPAAARVLKRDKSDVATERRNRENGSGQSNGSSTAPRSDTRQAPANPTDTSSRFSTGDTVAPTQTNRVPRASGGAMSNGARVYREQQQQRAADPQASAPQQRNVAPPTATAPRVTTATPPNRTQAQDYRLGQRASGGAAGNAAREYRQQRAQPAAPAPTPRAQPQATDDGDRNSSNADRGSRETAPQQRYQRDDGGSRTERQDRGGGGRNRFER